MKWISSLIAFAAVQTAFAAPVELAKRAAVTDVATVGYATLNGGTTGGSGGTTTTVTTLAALTSAVAGNAKKTVIISGTITGSTSVKVGSNTSVIGKKDLVPLVGVGFRVLNVENVIIRNVKVSKVLASAGDAIAVQASKQVWVDHVDLSSDKTHGKDFYDGLLDVTHGCTGVTITNSKLSEHYKASLVGHSNNNGAQDKAITVTYSGNYFTNINSRTPSLRFGTGHLFNNFFENNGDGINTRKGAQVLVENNVWSGAKRALYATDGGFAVATGNDFGGLTNEAPAGNFTKAPYTYSLLATTAVKASVTSSAGQTLEF
ncbi:pectate lyase B [Cyathus striatus]|nr:pectate lyase B [Cyathus striatus]